MKKSIADSFTWLEDRVEHFHAIEKVGKVVQVTGLIIESEGPDVTLGEVCEIFSSREAKSGMAEVVGFRENRVLLMPLEDMYHVHPGCRVEAASRFKGVPVGEGLLGRVIDGVGNPIDGKGALAVRYENRLYASAPNPMGRERIEIPIQTGVRAIDTFTPMGCGQRIGIFAGSGVGKSTLMSMIIRGADADVNVIALIGERGRELREFIENDLGPEGLEKSVVVVSTSDQPAPMRLRAALLSTSIAEAFRDEGKRVILMMDSLTRLAMAQREVGLAVGEPPTSRGYTPSVFSLLPRLLERTGMGVRGSITAFYNVLVEGDELNEPVSDAVRGILDGHIVLSRALATANHYPPIDVLESISRLSRNICTSDELAAVAEARDLLALYRKNEDLISIGAYVAGSNPKIDRSISKYGPLVAFLKQNFNEKSNRAESYSTLREILS